MNFGKWIVVSFILFAFFIGTLVVLCVREDISLVSKDYYKEELAFQEQIQRMNNTLKLTQKPIIKLIDQTKIQVEWGDSLKIEKGNLKLFCPSNSTMDEQFKLEPSTSQTFDIQSLQKGMYRVKLLWMMNGKEYYYEEEIYI